MRRELGHLDRFIDTVHPNLTAQDVIDLLPNFGESVPNSHWAHVVSEKENIDGLAIPLAELADNLDGDGQATFAAINPNLAIYQGERFNLTFLLGKTYLAST